MMSGWRHKDWKCRLDESKDCPSGDWGMWNAFVFLGFSCLLLHHLLQLLGAFLVNYLHLPYFLKSGFKYCEYGTHTHRAPVPHLALYICTYFHFKWRDVLYFKFWSDRIACINSSSIWHKQSSSHSFGRPYICLKRYSLFSWPVLPGVTDIHPGMTKEKLPSLSLFYTLLQHMNLLDKISLKIFFFSFKCCSHTS